MMNARTMMLIAAISCLQSTQVLAGRRSGGDGGGDNDNCTNDCQSSNPSQFGYFCGNAWEAKTADEKLDELWTQVELDITVQDQPWADIDNLFTQQVGKSFKCDRDELPSNRPKIIHSQGVVATVQWKDEGNHGYTGLYDQDSIALLRMSEANFDVPEITGLTPSLALKFPRNGMRSVNQLANVSFEPTNSFNFFAAPFRTNIEMFTDACAQETIQKKLLESSGWPNNLGLSEFASFSQDGVEVANADIKFPFDLWFEYAGDTTSLWPDWIDYSSREVNELGEEVPFYQQLQAIGNDTTLFNVMAREHPTAVTKKIATIVTTSDVKTSAFGDQRLFFQHEKKSADFDFRQELKCQMPKTETTSFNDPNNAIGSWPTNDADAKALLRGSIAEFGCPFAWLLNNSPTPIFDLDQ